MLQKHRLGIIAIVLGVSALVCAVLWESGADERRRAHLENERQRQAQGKHFEVNLKELKVTFGKKKEQEAVEPAPVTAEYPPLYIATLILSVAALILGPLAWIKEKEPIVSVIALTFGGVALFLHYVVIGISIGVAVVIIVALAGGMS
ncbi:MAG: hypothetical protein OEV64_13385 [Desulfobulbaceae bacterium]|nr:hypothetical protein [Desulfobulbaceae bacterium]